MQLPLHSRRKLGTLWAQTCLHASTGGPQTPSWWPTHVWLSAQASCGQVDRSDPHPQTRPSKSQAGSRCIPAGARWRALTTGLTAGTRALRRAWQATSTLRRRQSSFSGAASPRGPRRRLRLRPLRPLHLPPAPPPGRLRSLRPARLRRPGAPPSRGRRCLRHAVPRDCKRRAVHGAADIVIFGATRIGLLPSPKLAHAYLD